MALDSERVTIESGELTKIIQEEATVGLMQKAKKAIGFTLITHSLPTEQLQVSSCKKI